MSSFLQGHVEAFEAFGGVPRILLPDDVPGNIIVDHACCDTAVVLPARRGSPRSSDARA